MTEKIVAAHYDNISKDYEAWYTLDWPQPAYQHGKIINELIHSNALEGSLRILDLTCGMGTQSLGLATYGHHLTSIDISKGQLERARSEEKNFPVAHAINWIEGDSTHPTQYVTGTFDVAFSFGTSLPLLGSEQAIEISMKETFSLLKSGGLLLISMIDHAEVRKTKPYLLETGPLNHNNKKGVYLETANWLDDGKRYQSNIIFVWTSPKHEHAHYSFPPLAAITKDEFIQILEKIGFIDIKFQNVNEVEIQYPIYIAKKP